MLARTDERSRAAHEVVQETKVQACGFSEGGWKATRRVSWRPTGRSPTARTPRAWNTSADFAVVDVPSREEALEWAAKIAVACRWAQEVRELLPDPTVW